MTAATTLARTTIPTPLGDMHAVANDAGLLLLDFTDRRDIDKGMREFVEAPIDLRHPHLASIARELAAYFAGESMTFDTPVVLRGTDFENRCWRYLQTIPPGDTRSYGQQASSLGDVGAARAVGRANGMNFLSVIVPCHRVIASTGDLTGYGGGVKRKAWLLEHERIWAMCDTK
jgi:AraC family transcriptional regulator, regulatory protein of adaptative response / methylated-DNA-[protein]-cysteine methyltransferase